MDVLLPENDKRLDIGDQLLICGQPDAETHMRWTAQNLHALIYISSGSDSPCGTLWRRLEARKQTGTQISQDGT